MDTNTASVVKTNDKELMKTRLQGFVIGTVVGGIVVASIKDDSDTIKEIASAIVKVATSYYGCKFLYKIFS